MKDCTTEIPEDTTDCSDEEEDGSYIEIELETTSAPPTCYNDDDGIEQEQEDKCQLRISISSTISVSLPEEVQKESTNINQSADEPKVAANSIGAPSSSLMSCSADEAGFEVEFPVQNRLFSTVSFYPRPIVSWESPQPDAQTTIQGTTRVMIPCDNVDMLYSRKQPSLTTTTTTTTTTNGIMMKLLIKFRGIKIGALFASLMKPRQQPCQVNNNAQKSSKKSKTFFQCYQKGLVNPSNGRRSTAKRDQGRRSKHWDLEDGSNICAPFRNSRKCSSRVMEMDLGALRGVFNFNAMGIMSISQRGSRSKRRTGSVTSCDNSPIHEGFSLCSGDQSSVQAAIAYCKSSFGQTSDFTFRSSISSSPSQFV